MPTQFLKIPHERIGVLIGKNGSVKAFLEEKGACSIQVDSESGEVLVEGEDALKVFRVAEVVKAIGRGFSPEKAFKLLDDELLIFDILSLSHLSEKALKRIKGRIIGKNGRTRQIIEELTGADVSVYGKTVAFIGNSHQIKVAREAVEMLVNGAPHGTVYRFLERKRREMAFDFVEASGECEEGEGGGEEGMSE